MWEDYWHFDITHLKCLITVTATHERHFYFDDCLRKLKVTPPSTLCRNITVIIKISLRETISLITYWNHWHMIEGTTTETLKVRWLLLSDCGYILLVTGLFVSLCVHWLGALLIIRVIWYQSIVTVTQKAMSTWQSLLHFVCKHIYYLATSLVSSELWNLTVLNQACWISLLSTCRLDFNFLNVSLFFYWLIIW